MRALWSSRDGSRRAWARERALAVGRHRTASPWRFVGGPRRAHTGWRRVAKSNGLEGARLGEPGAGEVAWPGGRRVAGGLAHGRRWTGEGREQREEREN